jgi:hypothetical protein
MRSHDQMCDSSNTNESGSTAKPSYGDPNANFYGISLRGATSEQEVRAAVRKLLVAMGLKE